MKNILKGILFFLLVPLVVVFLVFWLIGLFLSEPDIHIGTVHPPQSK